MPASKSKTTLDNAIKSMADDISGTQRSPVDFFQHTKRKSGSHEEALESLGKLRTAFEEKLAEVEQQPASKENTEYANKLKNSIQQVENTQIYFGDPKYAKDPKAGKNNFDDFKHEQNKQQSAKENYTKPKSSKGGYYDGTELPQWIKNFGNLSRAINEKLGIDEKALGLLFDAKQKIKKAFSKNQDPSQDFNATAHKKSTALDTQDMPTNTSNSIPSSSTSSRSPESESSEAQTNETLTDSQQETPSASSESAPAANTDSSAAISLSPSTVSSATAEPPAQTDISEALQQATQETGQQKQQHTIEAENKEKKIQEENEAAESPEGPNLS